MQEAYRLATNGDDKVATHQVLGDGGCWLFSCRMC